LYFELDHGFDRIPDLIFVCVDAFHMLELTKIN